MQWERGEGKRAFRGSCQHQGAHRVLDAHYTRRQMLEQCLQLVSLIAGTQGSLARQTQKSLVLPSRILLPSGQSCLAL